MLNSRGVEITWLGHAAFRMRSAGKVFYFDPFLEQNPKCPEAEKKPGAADVILLSHGHADHSADAAALAKRTHATVICTVEVGLWLASHGVAESNVMGMNKGGTVEVGGARISMVHADHSSTVQEDGKIVYLGEPVGYVVEFQEGLKLYFAGDTALFGDMKLIGEYYQPEVALLPIGNFYTMDPRQAAYACRLLGPKTVIPMHFGTWPVLSGTPAELRQHLAGSGCDVLELTPGKTWK